MDLACIYEAALSLLGLLRDPEFKMDYNIQY